MQQSIQKTIQLPTRMTAAEAALMRWYPTATLNAIRALIDELPGWPVVPKAQGGAA